MSLVAEHWSRPTSDGVLQPQPGLKPGYAPNAFHSALQSLIMRINSPWLSTEGWRETRGTWPDWSPGWGCRTPSLVGLLQYLSTGTSTSHSLSYYYLWLTWCNTASNFLRHNIIWHIYIFLPWKSNSSTKKTFHHVRTALLIENDLRNVKWYNYTEIWDQEGQGTKTNGRTGTKW